ncbi:uncharacterized protein F4822DRAFT_231187 [Hypoxylon trugodes]|uniref:uncharacterized protein n=1 Tax=Hypoxylon trugodes TaxID=326681 RepID=UPI00219994C5|nr:uncharacterized protein F4822DRAFT_231187 [Hypoxylon trugodes]KAI1390272.1 hypothetical protein F4822DRAFT_231187 [Hypoxylon trugodes]
MVYDRLPPKKGRGRASGEGAVVNPSDFEMSGALVTGSIEELFSEVPSSSYGSSSFSGFSSSDAESSGGCNGGPGGAFDEDYQDCPGEVEAPEAEEFENGKSGDGGFDLEVTHDDLLKEGQKDCPTSEISLPQLITPTRQQRSSSFVPSPFTPRTIMPSSVMTGINQSNSPDSPTLHTRHFQRILSGEIAPRVQTTTPQPTGSINRATTNIPPSFTPVIPGTNAQSYEYSDEEVKGVGFKPNAKAPGRSRSKTPVSAPQP